MESFLSNLGPHVSSFLNILVMKHINTGDRMLDNVIQIISTTVLTAIVAGILHLTKKEHLNQTLNTLRSLVDKKSYNPLEFNPALAPLKPQNGVVFLYQKKILCSNYDSFVAWFFLHHSNKYFPQERSKAITIPGKTMMEDILNTNADDSALGEFSLPTATPVWKNRDGYYVYSISRDLDVTYLYSDNAEALRECYYAILKFYHEREAYTKAKSKTEKTITIKQFKGGDISFCGTINKKKTFDSLFFPNKDTVLVTLKAFKEEKLYPTHMPIDNKLGIMLYGPPGTGKTGFISALANFLRRDVMMVHMSRITTRKAFDQLLDTSISSRYIYVFEEFDCMPGVQRRVETVAISEATAIEGSTGTNGTIAMAMLMAGAGSSNTKSNASESIMEEIRKEREQSLDKLDVGYILTKLDGLESAQNRIMIATTNHPERIDPALMRPGRFDLQLHLSRCTRKMLVDILRFTYQLDESKISDVELALKDVPDFKWSPAELLQLTTIKTYDEIVPHLKSNKPSGF